MLHCNPFRASPGKVATHSSRPSRGGDCKGKLSPVLYLIAIPLAFVNSWIASGLYVFFALLWLIPDPWIERELEKRDH